MGQYCGMASAADRDWVIAQAKAVGFDLCGIAPAEALDENELEHATEWLARGYAGQMRYLHDERRADPTRVLPGAKSIIVCALNYNAAQPASTNAAAAARGQTKAPARGWISRYAWVDDYHNVVGEKLVRLVAALAARFGENFAARAYVDTGPIGERAAAQRAGLGWLAKNTCLINEDLGSWLFLGVIITSLDFADSSAAAAIPAADLCGNCRLCIDACPTEALVEPYVMDARRCIAYLTIELRESIPEEFRSAMGWQVFGCDICQDVCPWNRKSPATSQAAFAPREKLFAPELEWLLSLDEIGFREVFRGSPVRRTKWRGLMRNACIAAGNAPALAGDAQIGPLRKRLSEIAAGSDELLAEHARWALAQLPRVPA
jgi:epoxyqueuosine reductase